MFFDTPLALKVPPTLLTQALLSTEQAQALLSEQAQAQCDTLNSVHTLLSCPLQSVEHSKGGEELYVHGDWFDE